MALLFPGARYAYNNFFNRLLKIWSKSFLKSSIFPEKVYSLKLIFRIA